MYPPLVLIVHKSVNKAKTSFMYHFFSILWCRYSQVVLMVQEALRGTSIKLDFFLCEKQREMLVSISHIIREEINAAIDELQTQLNSMKEDLSEWKQTLKHGGHTLEKSKQLLMKENKELREKAESLESHSSKFNLRVFRLVVSLLNELFRDKNVEFCGICPQNWIRKQNLDIES